MHPSQFLQTAATFYKIDSTISYFNKGNLPPSWEPIDLPFRDSFDLELIYSGKFQFPKTTYNNKEIGVM